ncbi:hypothetical protein DCAR_0622734 [Daucus carota subsp. sativus]|uniref:Uncharacterized protein n=1 Tax=Daucus carota subsp. sativus TaxID=79200 RepID=A0AAF0XA73_DAUCS|nr:hypothetical protein DCAR_0622708 [Daucus carota subsp. sativus]WOH03315.1 hypothetical protein DCAR_0622711 [Daucus carota subsp. sativus]WOH03317.1 hypothetical protein DCAR_0622713 [Daucus carota subsp. sativus]WOH03337.1 hypothetical protein DCAR_0622734 [Daucus carota subsp. sativus]
MSRRALRSLRNLRRKPGRSVRRRGERFHVNGTCTWRVLRELRKGIGLKFLNRDVAADGNVRESGDVGGGLGKSYLFSGGRVQRLVEHRTSRGVRCAPGGP